MDLSCLANKAKFLNPRFFKKMGQKRLSSKKHGRAKLSISLFKFAPLLLFGLAYAFIVTTLFSKR